MFNSKAFCIIVILTALAIGAAVALQYMEMDQYDLVRTLQEKYLSGSTEAQAAEAPAETPAKEESAKDEAE